MGEEQGAPVEEELGEASLLPGGVEGGGRRAAWIGEVAGRRGGERSPGGVEGRGRRGWELRRRSRPTDGLQSLSQRRVVEKILASKRIILQNTHAMSERGPDMSVFLSKEG